MRIEKEVWLMKIILLFMFMTSSYAQINIDTANTTIASNATNSTMNKGMDHPSVLPTNATSTDLASNSTSFSNPVLDDDNNLPLHTVIDPAFSITGAMLILSGLPMAFVGHRCTWYVAFISGFYSTAIVVLSLILRFGQARAITDPSNTVKGLFLLACIFGGIIGGVCFIIFRQGALLITCALGGFAFALFLQACRPNGLIEVIGFRYIFFIALISLSFALACYSRLTRYMIVLSTAIIGASATILGIDCFIRANLKEFYIRNIGFDDLFEKRYPTAFASSRWPLSPSMVIELGVLAGTFVMAIALQGKMWSQLKASLEIMKQQDAERQAREREADQQARGIFARAQMDYRFWKRQHKEDTSVEDPLQSPNLTLIPSTAMLKHDNLEEKQGSPDQEKPFIDLPAQRSGILSPELANELGINTSSIDYTERSKLDTDPITPSEALPSDPITDEIREKEKYLEQIAAIRKSIHDLRSSSPSGTGYHTTSDLMFSRGLHDSDSRSIRKSQASAMTLPVLRNDVTKPIRPVSLGNQMLSQTELMGGEAEREIESQSGIGFTFPYDRKRGHQERILPTSPAKHDESYLGEFAVLSASERSLNENLNSNRPRSMLLGTLKQEKIDSHHLIASDSKRRRVYSMIPFPASSSIGSNDRLVVSQDRIIVGAPTSSHFTSPIETGQATSHSLSNQTTLPAKAMLKQMTGNELQARHNARLSALQRPLSTKMNEEVALAQAKEEWQKRKNEERKRWQEQERRRSISPKVPK